MRYMILFILMASSAYAAEVGVVISFPEHDITKCLEVAEGMSGFDLLDGSFQALWAEHALFGHQLCMIEGVGDTVSFDACEYSGKYWGFSTYDDGWQYMPVGFDGGSCWNGDFTSYDGHYCAKEGDVVGLHYGEFGQYPTVISFEDICGPNNQVKQTDEPVIYVKSHSQTNMALLLGILALIVVIIALLLMIIRHS